MAVDEKDRLGNKLRDAERAREDQYFAEQDRKLVEKLRSAKQHEVDAAIKDATHMRCPKCGTRLEQRAHHGVSVDECPSCHGVWLGKGELDMIGGRETDSWIARWLRREFEKPEGA